MIQKRSTVLLSIIVMLAVLCTTLSPISNQPFPNGILSHSTVSATEVEETEEVHGSEGSEPIYDYEVITGIEMPMRDGTLLAADLYLPQPLTATEEEDGFPSLVMRTPYSKTTYGNNHGPFFAERGYAVFVQNTRGRFDSEGEYNFLFDDARDGYDTIEWVAVQEWSNGKVGTFGHSYMSYTQELLSFSKPPSLVTMVPVQGMSNPAEDVMFTGGAMQLDRYLSWGLRHSRVGARPCT
jgi:uncharacterized protein